MKIMKHGFMSNSPEGIYFTCSICGCEYLVESREDLKHCKVQEWVGTDTEGEHIGYISACPECGYEIEIGIDPKTMRGFRIESGRLELFNRPDWKERFEVSL